MAGAFEPEIAQVTSNTLQAEIRSLLPSVSGFGSRLGAQNVIVPVIDLTQVAGGSALTADLQQAITYGNQTSFNVVNQTTTILSNPGFYRVFGTTTNSNYHSDTSHVRFQMTDGSTSKVVWANDFAGDNSDATVSIQFDFLVFLATGISMEATANTVNAVLSGSTRQVADSNGVTVNPSGYTAL